MNSPILRRLAFLTLALPFSLAAQKLDPTFGILTVAEHEVKAPAGDPDAEAVIVFDIAKTRFVNVGAKGLVIMFHRMKRVKVLARSGVRHAEISIPFFREDREKSERIASIEAITYNLENGRIIKRILEQSTVYEEQVSEKWWVKKFAIPDVKENTVFEFRYTHETPFFFNLPDWKFQDAIPTQYSEYSVGMNPFYEYDYIAQGMDKFDYQHSEQEFPEKYFAGVRYNDQVTTFVLKNIPAFKDESFITTQEDFLLKVDFQLSKVNYPDGTHKLIRTTWPDLCKSLLDREGFGKYINSSRRLAKDILTKEPTLQVSPPEKKYQAIINYVRSQFRWNERTGFQAIKSPKEVFSQKTGSAAEINLFLVAMLAEAGADVTPMILSTRDHGKVHTQYPFEHFFNYVVVFVNGQRPFVTDGTDSRIAYDRIPLRCLNDQGLLVALNAENWVELEPITPSHEEVTLRLKINEAQASADVLASVSSLDYQAYGYRARFENDTLKIKKYFKDNHQLEASKTSSHNYDMTSRPYVMMATGVTPLEVIGSKLVVQPLLSFGIKENPLRHDKRSYPVDFVFPHSTTVRSIVSIPAGYTVEATPDAISVDNELAKVMLTSTVTGSELQIVGTYTFKRNTYMPADYELLKDLLALIVKGFNTPVVLDKH